LKDGATVSDLLLDSNVIIDTLNDRNDRPRLLAELSHQDILLACCSINVTEVYMGMRPGEETKPRGSAKFGVLRRHLGGRHSSLVISSVNGGRKVNACIIRCDYSRRRAHQKLMLVTDNRKHFPMPELQIVMLPPAV